MILAALLFMGTPAQHDFLSRLYRGESDGFSATVQLARPSADRSFTLTGVVEGRGLSYELTGTVYRTGKARGSFKRRTSAGLFQEPVDGLLEPDGRTLRLEGKLFVPGESDRRMFYFELLAPKEAQRIRVLKKAKVSGLEAFEGRLDLEKGTYREAMPTSDGGTQEWTVTFSPFPLAVEFGEAGTFWVSKEKVPLRAQSKMSMTLLALDQREPRIQIFCEAGQRKNAGARWAPLPGQTPILSILAFPNGRDPARVTVEYESVEMTRQEFDQTAQCGVQPSFWYGQSGDDINRGGEFGGGWRR